VVSRRAERERLPIPPLKGKRTGTPHLYFSRLLRGGKTSLSLTDKKKKISLTTKLIIIKREEEGRRKDTRYICIPLKQNKGLFAL